MNALDAFRNATGHEPTALQIEQAEEWGGLHDADTIASIPVQIADYEAALEAERGLVLNPDQRHHLYSMISLKAYDTFAPTLGVNRDQKAKAVMGLLGSDWPRKTTPLPMHPIWKVYREVFGRAPDNEGFQFWCEKLEEHKLSWIREQMIIAWERDQAAGQLVNSHARR